MQHKKNSPECVSSSSPIYSSDSHVQLWLSMLRSSLQVAVSGIFESPISMVLVFYLYLLTGLGFVLCTPFLNEALALPSILAKLFLYLSPVFVLVVREWNRREKLKSQPSGWIRKIERELSKTKHI